MRFIRDEDGMAETSHVTYTAQSLLWGLLPLKGSSTPDPLCGSQRIVSVQTAMTTTQVMLTVVTAGIYVPQRVDVSCH